MLILLCACVGFDAIPEKPDPVGYDSAADTGEPVDTSGGTTTSNGAPEADAGPDRSAAVGRTVDLDGSGSSDPDGDSLAFTWTIESRPGGSLSALTDSTDENPQFTPDMEGTWVFSLVVDDGELESDPDEVVVSASLDGSPPVADAGPDQLVVTGQTVYLDGSGSSDPDGDPLSFTWTMTNKPGGSGTVLNSATSATPRFLADVSGTYELSLVVGDGAHTSVADTVSVRADAEEDTGSGCGCRGTSLGDLLVGVFAGLLFFRRQYASQSTISTS